MLPMTDTKERGVRLVATAILGGAIVYPILPVHPATCPLRSTTGIPCPFCGMTRAVAAAVHGDIVGSLRFNPAGVLFAVLVVALLVRPRLVQRLQPPLWVMWAGLGVLWIWNIGFNPTFHQWLLPG